MLHIYTYSRDPFVLLHNVLQLQHYAPALSFMRYYSLRNKAHKKQTDI